MEPAWPQHLPRGFLAAARSFTAPPRIPETAWLGFGMGSRRMDQRNLPCPECPLQRAALNWCLQGRRLWARGVLWLCCRVWASRWNPLPLGIGRLFRCLWGNHSGLPWISVFLGDFLSPLLAKRSREEGFRREDAACTPSSSLSTSRGDQRPPCAACLHPWVSVQTEPCNFQVLEAKD